MAAAAEGRGGSGEVGLAELHWLQGAQHGAACCRGPAMPWSRAQASSKQGGNKLHKVALTLSEFGGRHRRHGSSTVDQPSEARAYNSHCSIASHYKCSRIGFLLAAPKQTYVVL